MSALKAALFAATVVAAASFTLEPPPNSWSRIGSSLSLVCKASQPLKSCSWGTPYGTIYVLGDGFSAESGRLNYVSSNENECGIVIEGVKEADDGVWSCHAGFDDGGEVRPAKGQSTLSIARRPGKVELIEPHNLEFTNVTDLAEPVEVKCSVKNAKPAPKFSWTIDDVPLENVNTLTDKAADDSTWIQTLSYVPDLAHDNQTLRCVVSHVGFHEEDERQAATVMRFITNRGVVESMARQTDSQPLVATLSTLGSVFAVTCIALGSWTLCRRWRRSAEQPKEQVTESSETAGGEEPSNSGEKDTAVTSCPDVPAGGRFARYIRLAKRRPLAKDVETGNDTMESEQADKVKDDEVKSEAEDALNEREDEPQPKSSRFSFLFDLFKRSRADKADSVVVEEKLADVEEGVSDKKGGESSTEEQAEKMLELEPEDKPESNNGSEEKQDDENKSPINTSV